MNRTIKNMLIILLGTFGYGCALGWWRSPLMAVYVGVKLPIVFFATTIFVSVFSWMVALLLGVEMRYRDVFDHLFAAMAWASKILLALLPVMFFMIGSGAPTEGTTSTLRFAHACLMLMHLIVLSLAGVVGNLRLYADLRQQRKGSSQGIQALLACWLVCFAVVGGQIGWMLRPLVGSPNIAVEFLRADALKSNILESVCLQIIPHFIHQGKIK